MKKIVCLMMTLALCVLLCACGSTTTDTPTTMTVVTEPPTAIERLSKNERKVFDALIELTTTYFYKPSAVRVLEIGDYEKSYKDAETVVVCLQGENQVGGTLNRYYVICVDDGGNSADDIIYNDGAGVFFPVNAKVGSASDLGTTHTFKDSNADEYDLDAGNINKALIEYWKDMGFEN